MAEGQRRREADEGRLFATNISEALRSIRDTIDKTFR